MNFCNRRSLLGAVALISAPVVPNLSLAAGSACHDARLSEVLDVQGATPELVRFLKSFFTAKSRRDVEATMSFFSPELITYTDATLGWDVSGYAALRKIFQEYMAKWPETAKSYPTRIIGDMNSCVVAFTDTAELFGGELRILGTIDFKDKKIIRWVDTWDGRGWPNLYQLTKTRLSIFKAELHGEHASTRLRSVCESLAAALGGADASAATELYSADAVYEDNALRLKIEGKQAIGRYLGRASKFIPNGLGSKLRHVVGSAYGGGYEWDGGTSARVHTGTTALLLDSAGKIMRSTSVFDSSLLENDVLMAIQVLGLDAPA